MTTEQTNCLTSHRAGCILSLSSEVLNYREAGEEVAIDDRLSVPEAARLAGVSERSIHNWINAGKLTADEQWHGKQRRRYVSRAAVQELVGKKRDDQT